MGSRSRSKAARRGEVRAETPAPASAAGGWTRGRFVVAVFAAAFAMRLLFWQATADHAWGWSAWYKGDAPVWLDYARTLQAGQEFERGLPIHPPGAGYLVSALWNGLPGGLPWLRFCWVLMGAALVALVWWVLVRPFGPLVAGIAAYLCAVSSGLIVLGSSVNNEIPYLLLVVGSLALFEDARAGASLARVAAFAALNGIACLFRVEHALAVVLFFAILALAWRRAPMSALAVRSAVMLAAFVVPLVPWQVAAWNGIERFNDGPRVFERGEDMAIGQVERALSSLVWTKDAEERRAALPAFLRRTTSVFVAATVAYRGGQEVRGQDFAILDEAFGSSPRPLARHPFVSSYGPLNFYLANRRGAPGGFDRSPLERKPPLAGGADTYPAFLVGGLPPPDLTFVYPPHLELFNDGYALGWREIRADPGAWLALGARKLRIFWAGASLGAGGFDLPLGLSGLRRAVDLVVPTGPMAIAWSVAVLAACLAGLVAGRRQPALRPWLAFLASKLVTTVLFFGYARQGALVTPVVALLAALAIARWGGPLVARLGDRRAGLAIALALALPVVLEAARWLQRPQVTIDGRAIGAVDPFPPDDHRDQAVAVR